MLKNLNAFLIAILLPFAVNASNINQSLLTIEIEGISLSTPNDAIPGILKNHGYHQATTTTYTRRSPADGQRMSIHRIEITDTSELRQINYIREKSGGRIKSPPKVEESILESELDAAQKIYHIVCAATSPEIQNERLCQPESSSNITFNQSNMVTIDNNFEVSLNASAANTVIRLKYSKD